jgi:hypothetical protein
VHGQHRGEVLAEQDSELADLAQRAAGGVRVLLAFGRAGQEPGLRKGGDGMHMGQAAGREQGFGLAVAGPAETETDGPLVARVENKIMRPTPYSPLSA